MNSVTKKILAYYKKHGRHSLPWRNTKSPYHILVSEIMLQQTQVERVVPKYYSFLKRFPTVEKLAIASLGDVLREWQGLGYNRRGKMLHDAARGIQARYEGQVPRTREELEALPGIGHYTAGAIRAFAFDEPDDFLETNIRTVLIHEFFPTSKHVRDQKLLELLPKLRGKVSSRLFYSALMDYGAMLKGQGIRLNAKSKHYTKQKPFKGSDREVRGAILRSLAGGDSLLGLKFDAVRMSTALAQLQKEKLIVRRGRAYSLPK